MTLQWWPFDLIQILISGTHWGNCDFQSGSVIVKVIVMYFMCCVLCTMWICQSFVFGSDSFLDLRMLIRLYCNLRCTKKEV